MTDGSCRSHMADYFLRGADGGGIVVDIKPDDLIDANDRINFAATAALCDAVGWTYRRLGGLPDVLTPTCGGWPVGTAANRVMWQTHSDRQFAVRDAILMRAVSVR
jgi:hypothetical protein